MFTVLTVLWKERKNNMKKFLAVVFVSLSCVFATGVARAESMYVSFYDCNWDTGYCLQPSSGLPWPTPEGVDMSGGVGNWTWDPVFTGFDGDIVADEDFNGFNMRSSCDAETQILWIDENGNVVEAATDFDPDMADDYYDYSGDNDWELDLYPCNVPLPAGETYNVTYSCGTGSGNPPAAETATENRKFTPPAADGTTCSKAGYTISGWAVSGTSDVKQPGTSFKWEYTEDKTLTAQWTQDSAVTYSCGTGATGTPPAGATGYYGQTFTPAANTCSKSGYTFVGWDVSGTNDVFSNTFVWNYTGDKTLTAHWLTDSDFKFSITTTNMSADTTFEFAMSATGTFYVDWGDGIGETIIRTNTSATKYSHTYSSAGVRTIRFGGTATGYVTGYYDSAITFGAYTDNNGASTNNLTSATRIASVTGGLSAIFPWLSGNSASGAAPRFYKTFYGATNLTSIPATLFSGYTTGANYMFRETFYGCTSLTTIPTGLFSGITTGANYMFYHTFNGCTSLTTIPTGLFSNITTGATGMFWYTFYGCTALTTIPSNLFSGITTGAEDMFSGTFYGCTALTTIPDGLFSGITTRAGGMFYNTFQGCTSLTTIPSNLFSGITTGAVNMFSSTFKGCTSLTTIPTGLFSGITTGANNMFYQTFSGCTSLTTIPTGLFSGITTGAGSMFESTFSGCTSLTTIPSNLFSGITTGAVNMFSSTFKGCTNLSGYIPPTTFAGLIANGHPTASNMWRDAFYNTQLVTTCPTGTTQYITGYEGSGTSTWNGKVSCTCAAGNYYNGTSCAACANTKPANSSWLSGDIASTCAWKCDAGYVENNGSCVACPANQIAGADGTCQPVKFSVTTTALSANTEISLKLSAAGTFYVNWGDGVEQTINRTNTTTDVQYTHRYTAAGTYTIGFGGTATGYSTSTSGAAISFDTTTTSRQSIASLSGSLSAMFPYLGSGSGQQPRFYNTFFGATKLTTVPGSLFSGYTTGAERMFYSTFEGCTSLTTIPTGLFSGITTGANNMFQYTFYGCTSLTTIPTGLFSGITTGAERMFYYTFQGCTALTTIPTGLFSNNITNTANASDMFSNTFSGCTKLTTIPSNLFSGITTGASYMFSNTFNGCKKLTTIPTGLFSGITTGAEYMFYNTFRGCTALTTIPSNLFSGITTGANYMFYSTFDSCTSLTTIPSGLFSGITTGAQYMFYNTFQGCTALTTIPTGLFSGITTGAERMFYNTFYGCTSLTTIPSGLFSGITTGATYMFTGTFQNCTSLTTIPSGLFSNNITNTANATYMFISTFNGCTSLTTIPSNLFSGITTGADYMFSYTFEGCTSLTTIPTGLFSGVTTGANNMFYYTFQNCTSLTTIPSGLFSGITTGAERMFFGTFSGCTNLAGYIPPSTFAGLIVANHPTASNMWNNTFSNTQLATSCPTGTTQYITGYEGSGTTTWDGKVACVPDCGAGKYMPAASFACSACAAGSYCDGTSVSYSYNANAAQGTASCSTATSGLYPSSAAGASTTDDCYLTLTSGKYVETTGQGATDCAANSYNDSTANVYYGGTNTENHPTTSTCSACSSLGGGLYTTSVAGSASTGCYITTTEGKYIPNNTDTEPTACPAYKYCVARTLYWPTVSDGANAPEDCPTADNSTQRTTYPESFLNPTLQSFALTTNTGLTKLTKCRASYTLTNAAGRFVNASVYYNTASGKYDNGSTVYYNRINPGYYGYDKYYSAENCNLNTTRYMYYRSVGECPTGSYCPGYTTVPRCNTGSYEETLGLNSCPTDYPNSASGSSAVSACYVNTAPGYYVATANAAPAICPVNNYCPTAQIYYGQTNSASACATGLYAPAGMWESAQCGHILHIGESVYLRGTKQTTPSLNVKIGDSVFYGNMTTLDVPMTNGTNRKLKLRYNGATYSVYDDTVTP